MVEMESSVFASTLLPNKWSEVNAILFLESIRENAGHLSKAPVWFFTPNNDKEISPYAKEKLESLNASITEFKLDTEMMKFPFIAEANAAGTAEKLAKREHDILIWLTTNTLILKEPSAFLLPERYAFGYRPVHHKLVGSRWGEPLDEFWSWVYKYCGIEESQIFPMTSHIDGEKIKPYFNAGSFSLRPEEGILERWRDAFTQGYQDPRLQALYQQDDRYAIFIHQALFTGVVLSSLERSNMLELPSSYNYPSHLHGEDVTDSKPQMMDQCTTIRHEGFYKDRDWKSRMVASDELKSWIEEKLVYALN